MAAKTSTGTNYHGAKATVDALQNDSTFSDLQRAAIQQCFLDLFKGLNGDSFAGKTATLKADVFNSATTPSMSVSLAFT